MKNHTKQEAIHTSFLDRKELQDGLGRKSLKAGSYSFAGEAVTFILRLASIAILARLLVPEYFGLIAMVGAFTAFLERFRDLGLTMVTVQQEKISVEQVSALFWINAGVGTILTMLIAGVAPGVAWFYDDGRLLGITLALSSSFFLMALSMQHRAILRRRMQFRRLAIINITSTFFSLALAVGMAFNGFGYWSLVWREISRAFFRTVGAWLLCPWMPSAPQLPTGIGALLRFGRNVAAFNLISSLSRNLDQLLIGKLWGASALGLYQKASQLIVTPVYQLEYPTTSVAEPALSTLQKDHARYREAYAKIVSTYAFFLMPVMVYLGVFSDVVVLTLLGAQWIGTIPIFTMLAIGAVIQPIVNTCGFVLVTCGKTKQYFAWGLVNGLTLVFGFCVGAYFGAVGVAIGYTIVAYITVIPSLWFLEKYSPVSAAIFIRSVVQPFACSVATAVLLYYFVRSGLERFEPAIHLLLGLPLTAASYALSFMFVPGGRATLRRNAAFLISFMAKTAGIRRARRISS